jgi:hypothetical protein
MMDSAKIRKWATPLTIGAFGLSAVSGIMIFFHVNSSLVKVAHEWGSWLLVVGGLFHVVGSWQSFVGYLSKPAARAILVVFALLIIIFFLPLSVHTERQGRKLLPAVLSRALPETSFAAVAGIAQHHPDELMKELGSKGIIIKDKEETIRDIARNNKKGDVEILNIIF